MVCRLVQCSRGGCGWMGTSDRPPPVFAVAGGLVGHFGPIAPVAASETARR